MSAPTMEPVHQELFDLERRFWTEGADFYERSVASDARFVFAETGTLSRDEAIDGLNADPSGGRWAVVTVSDERALDVKDDVVLLTYAVEARRAESTGVHRALCSSLYVRERGDWRLAFHQQSALA